MNTKSGTNVFLFRTVAAIALVMLAFAALPATPAYALACVASTSGNWSTPGTWTGCGTGVPGAGDTVSINSGVNVTVTTDAAATSITFPSNNTTTLTINSGVTLTVSGTITIPRANNNNMNTLAVGAGTLNAGSIAFTGSGGTNRHQVTISTGTVTVSGDVTVATPGDASPTISFSDAGILKLGGGLWSSGGGTLTTFTGSTVEYNRAGNQTVKSTSYSNLIFSGSGDKSMAAGTSVTGNLSIAPTGSAKASVGTGLNLSVNSLTLGGLGRINGTWGSTTSSATNQNNTYFAATTGRLNVTNDTRATPTVTTWPTASGITYGQALSASTLTGGSASTTGTFAFTTPSTQPDAGTFSAPVTFTPSDLTSYKTVAGNVDVLVAQAAQATLTAVITPSTVVYGSTAGLSSTGGSGAGTVTFSAGASTGCSVTGTTLSVTDAGGTCSITATKASDTNYLEATSAAASVTLQKAATTTTVTGGTFTYDGAAHAATVSVTGPGGLSLTPGASYSGSCSAAPSTVVEGTSCTASYNYAGDNNYLASSDSKSLVINTKAASVTPTDASKIYGDTDPALTGAVSGFVAGDNVTATYSRVAGETVAGGPYTISAVLNPAGVLSNYNITYNTANFTISTKAASVTPAAASKTYGNADPALTGSLSGFLPADNVTATYSRAAGETVAGSPYTISAVLSPAGVLSNYNITNNTASFTISPLALTISGLTANDKPYDGNNTATLSGTPALVGVLGSDAVTLGGTPVATFADANVGLAKPVTVTGFTLGGVDAGNYSLAQPTGLTASINGISLTVTGITTSNKVYDGTMAATLNVGGAALVGVVSGDDVTLNTTSAAGVFADKNVGTGKIVTISGLTLTGANAGKYMLVQPTATANITVRDLTVSATGVNKVYDGTTVATVTLSSDAVSGDLITLSYTSASFADPNEGNDKPVSVSGISIGGADAGNYHLLNTTASTTANITLTITHIADTTGVFRPSNGVIFLKNQNTTGFADVGLNYGIPGDYPVVGDWDGDGTTTIGIYRNGQFMLRNSNAVGFADVVFAFGQPGDQPIAGDWDGDGIDTIGVYRPSIGQFFLRNSNSAGAEDATFYLGNVGDVGIAGDWDGDGKDTTGVFRPSNGVIFLKNQNTTGFADVALNYGIPGDKPVIGDWDGDGIDTIGVYRHGQFMLRNSNTVGFADMVFGLGNPGDMPIAGDWDGLP